MGLKPATPEPLNCRDHYLIIKLFLVLASRCIVVQDWDNRLPVSNLKQNLLEIRSYSHCVNEWLLAVSTPDDITVLIPRLSQSRCFVCAFVYLYLWQFQTNQNVKIMLNLTNICWPDMCKIRLVCYSGRYYFPVKIFSADFFFPTQLLRVCQFINHNS